MAPAQITWAKSCTQARNKIQPLPRERFLFRYSALPSLQSACVRTPRPFAFARSEGPASNALTATSNREERRNIEEPLQTRHFRPHQRKLYQRTNSQPPKVSKMKFH